MTDPSGWMWFLMEVVFVAILAAGLIYGTIMWHNRRRNPAIERARDEATRRNYRESRQD
jgi:hypothetical protein